MLDLHPSELIRRLETHRPSELPSEPDIRRATVAVILKRRASDWDILFIKRARQEADPWSGQMAFPGGRVEETDASLVQAAKRETWEEVGIDLETRARPIGQLNDLQAMARGRRIPLVIRPFVFVLQQEQEIVPNKEEVDEVVWVPLSWLLSGDGNGFFEHNWRGMALDLPCIRFNGYLIWGLTYRMLYGLLTLLREHDS